MATALAVQPLPHHTKTLPMVDGTRTKVRQRGRRHTIITARPDGTYGTRRPRTSEEREMVADTTQARIVLASPDFWNVAHSLPNNAYVVGKNGRPNKNPSWVLLFLATLATLTGSQRGAIRFVSDPYMWDMFRTWSSSYVPNGFDPAPATPPTRDHLSYFVRKWKSDAWAGVRANADDAFRGTALALAQHLGNLRDDQPLRYNQPDPGQWVSYDGTVYRGPSDKQKDPSKPGRRVDPACGWHNKYGDEKIRVWGSKVVFASLRSEDYWGRIILDYSHVVGAETKTGIGDEAAVTLASAQRLKLTAPGMRGVIIDGVLRGKHITELSRLDIHTVNRPAALSNPERDVKGTNNDSRVEKSAKIGTHKHHRSNGTVCKHDVWVVGSNYHQRVLDASGSEAFVPLQVRTVTRRANRGGKTFRHYTHLSIPCRYGDTEMVVGLHHEVEGEASLSRGELLRYYPTGSAQFGVLYGRRNDTEALHSHMKKTMPRLPAYGTEAQSLFVLAYAVRSNAVARNLAVRAQSLPSRT